MPVPNRILHASFGIRDPKGSADGIAELTDGVVAVFEPHRDSYYIIWPGGQMLEVYPFETRLVPGPNGVIFREEGVSSGFGPSHFLLSATKTSDEISAIARRRGYLDCLASRGPFTVHEVWIQNEFMLELLTPPLLAQYLQVVKQAGFA